MQRFFIWFSYNGAAYHGWQIQPNGISVQEVLMRALSTILKTEIEVVGAGRTDAGVHAKLMVAHFDVEDGLPKGMDLVAKLNSFLPNDISVSRLAAVQPDAHARFDALYRRYEYCVVTQKNVFKTHTAARFHDRLDFDQMNLAATILLEYSDFTSFSKLHTDAKTNICNVTLARWKKRDEEWVFEIQADRFLRNMVRAVVGTLLEVGRGRMTLAEFRAVIEAKNRCKAGTSVPAHGLYLVDIQYPNSVFAD